MSTIAEIKAAIEGLSPRVRIELENWFHPDRPLPHDDTPTGIREKLAEAARGSFSPGDRLNIFRIRSTLK